MIKVDEKKSIAKIDKMQMEAEMKLNLTPKSNNQGTARKLLTMEGDDDEIIS